MVVSTTLWHAVMKKLEPISIRLDPEQRDALSNAAEDEGRSLSGMARWIIIRWLRKQGELWSRTSGVQGEPR